MKSLLAFINEAAFNMPPKNVITTNKYKGGKLLDRKTVVKMSHSPAHFSPPRSNLYRPFASPNPKTGLPYHTLPDEGEPGIIDKMRDATDQFHTLHLPKLKGRNIGLVNKLVSKAIGKENPRSLVINKAAPAKTGGRVLDNLVAKFKAKRQERLLGKVLSHIEKKHGGLPDDPRDYLDVLRPGFKKDETKPSKVHFLNMTKRKDESINEAKPPRSAEKLGQILDRIVAKNRRNLGPEIHDKMKTKKKIDILFPPKSKGDLPTNKAGELKMPLPNEEPDKYNLRHEPEHDPTHDKKFPFQYGIDSDRVKEIAGWHQSGNYKDDPNDPYTVVETPPRKKGGQTNRVVVGGMHRGTAAQGLHKRIAAIIATPKKPGSFWRGPSKKKT